MPHTSRGSLLYVSAPFKLPSGFAPAIATSNGVLQEAVGSVTGSQEWANSGDSQKAAAIKDIKAASQGRDPQKDGFGKIEELAGKAAGCEGMEAEGAKSKAS